MKRYLSWLMALCLLAICADFSVAQVTIIDDDLNTDTSSDYTVVNGGFVGGGDGTLDWAYDYSADGIPSAPGTTDDSTTGVKISVNNTLAATEAYTIFHNTEITGSADYTMTMDVWAANWSEGADTGSTEHAQFGVAADNTVRNHLFQFDGACCDFSGSGHFVALSSDGGDSSDYRHWEDNANGGATPGPVNQFDNDYLSPDMGTNVIGDNFVGFFENIANANAAFPGVIGEGWATVKIEVSQTEGLIKYFVRGYTNETTGPPGVNDPPEFLQIIESDLQDAEGFVNFGLADLYSSVAVIPEDQFAVFDNLFVEAAGNVVDGDFDGNGLYECNDVDSLVSAIVDVKNGGMPDLGFDLTSDGNVNDDDLVAWRTEAGAGVVAPALTASGNPVLVGDATLDGTVDGLDFIEWNNNKFTSVAAWCSGDFNADGIVDGLDFIEWNNNKFTTADHAAAVPEPSGLWLIGVALPLLLKRRR